MEKLKLLIKSVEMKKPIAFKYNKPGKTPGERIGNVYAVYIFTSKAGEKSTKLHIVQTEGVSDSKEKSPFPDFRIFNIEDISNIRILETATCFVADNKKYNPDWDGYSNPIAKV